MATFSLSLPFFISPSFFTLSLIHNMPFTSFYSNSFPLKHIDSDLLCVAAAKKWGGVLF